MESKEKMLTPVEKEYGTRSRRAATAHKTKKVRFGKRWSVHARIKIIARINTEAERLIWNRSMVDHLLSYRYLF